MKEAELLQCLINGRELFNKEARVGGHISCWPKRLWGLYINGANNASRACSAMKASCLSECVPEFIIWPDLSFFAS